MRQQNEVEMVSMECGGSVTVVCVVRRLVGVCSVTLIRKKSINGNLNLGIQ